ncbi:LPS-assembly protein LptD [Massilia sp. CF038]|uniref:LPS-assembly protein LptD n=1 Tax=Massilia sp. CF038 TaxID=1881045 RepID=UPI000919E5A9|nr:LPS-assembly protein LptD [Massilia sp. CF038]SHH55436.1 LPS-assembly protein [Massilia sp. CF038]
MSWFSAAPPSQRWAYALSALVTASAVPAFAQVPPKKPRVEDPNPTVYVQAEEISGRPDREIELNTDIELVRGETRVTADTACFKQVENEVTAKGNVRMWRFGDQYRGDELQLNMSSGKGWVLRPEYKMELNNAQGQATRLDFISEDEAFVTDGTYSTCDGPNPDWYLRSSTLRLDAGRDVGVAGTTVVYFKGVPILGTPALSFSLSGARRSGWLPPSIGFGSKGRAEVEVPYYINIAPNRDLTLYPRFMLDRGLLMGATGRYMGDTESGRYLGTTHVEFLLNDKLTKTDRWRVKSEHNQALTPRWSFGWALNGASDDNYPSDFSKSVSASAERQLLREVRTEYAGKYWNMSLRAQNYQILQDPLSVTRPELFVNRPYARLPELNFHAGRYDVGGFDWSVDSQITRFSHPDVVTGNRAVLVPQLSYPIVRPGYFIRPKLMVNASAYQLDSDRVLADNPTSLNRTLPTFSIDSGLVFERPTTFLGREATQTLEPRLFYVYTPYKDQSKFPNFDTAEASFNFSQIFNENRFVGYDRISDANQITAALVSRYLDPNGAERLRLAIGQRFYLNDQRVQLSSATPVSDSRSDALVAASGRISESWAFDSAVQYNASTSSVVSSNYGLQWQPGEKKVINAEYRFVTKILKNVDLSSQWPLTARWYGVGRVSYSLLDKKIVEGLIGLEYKADCWVFRMGAQRFVTTTLNTSTPIFFQLELNGLSKLGFGSPLESFYKSIPGYSRLNQGAGR